MNAGRAVALLLAAGARRRPEPLASAPLAPLPPDRVRRLALALAAPPPEAPTSVRPVGRAPVPVRRPAVATEPSTAG